MAILNEDLEWNRWATDPKIRLAFRGTPVKTLFPVNTTLCRFITAESKRHGIPGNEIYLSPWWSEWDTTAQMLDRWKTRWTTPREVLRARFAVTKEYSAKLDGLVQIILIQPVFAWKGIAAPMTDRRQKVTYLGGAEQLFLPNLSSDPFGLNSNVAYMHCFSWVDSLQ